MSQTKQVARRKSSTKNRTSNTNRRSKRKTEQYFDYSLLACIIFLMSFGLIMLYSTSAYRASIDYGSDMYYFRKQFIFCILGLFVMWVVSRMDYHILVNFSVPLFVVSVFLLIITKFIGVEVNGATRWIKVGPITFQPAEITKVAVILLLSGLISKMGKRMKGIAAPCIIIAIALVAAGCTYIFTENMSTAIIILGIAGIMLLIVHPTIQRLIPLGVVVAAAGIYGLRRYVTNNGVSGRFRLMRILVWIKPEEYSADGGYQIIQALYAIGSGGFFGKGLGNSTQKLVALPEAQNDMIFSIICEELGVFGAAMLIMLFMFLLYRLLVIAENAPDLTGSLVVTGVFGHIALQVLLNIAVVINLIPTTGITLPLVSYGGTSVVFLMIELGLVANVASHIRVRSEATAPEIQEQRREQLREKREMEKVRHIR